MSHYGIPEIMGLTSNDYLHTLLGIIKLVLMDIHSLLVQNIFRIASLSMKDSNLLHLNDTTSSENILWGDTLELM